MQWFGKSWNSTGVCADESNHLPAPVGRACFGVCGRTIAEGDQGVVMPFHGGTDDPPDAPYHLECLLDCLGISKPIVLPEGWSLDRGRK